MEGEKNQSSGAEEHDNSKHLYEIEEQKRSEKIDEQGQLSSGTSNYCTAENDSSCGRGKSKPCQSENLASVQLSRSDFQFNESSHHLSEVPVEHSLQPLLSVEELKEQGREIQEEPSKTLSSQSTHVLTQLLTCVPDGPLKLKLPPISVSQSMSSVLSSSSHEPKVSENGSNSCISEHDKHISPATILKPPSDGYNWRKYGQKQVKSPEGFRSYYRCTFTDCCAKKIDCCDSSNHVIETVYRSLHNHDPPLKLNCTRENKADRPVMPTNGSNDTAHSVRHLGNSISATSSKEPVSRINRIPETKQPESSDSDETTETNEKDEFVDDPECKNGRKRISSAELDCLRNQVKKPKFVVHTAGDVGISGDSHRWRKYGQKMVKGNPFPRNYYRCTSAGCPVRKHIERAVDNTSALAVTYKGVHNHDVPVPRKRHGPNCTPLVSPTSPGSASNSPRIKINCPIQTHWSLDKEGDLTSEPIKPSGKKASEPSQTLLSVGFEIKPC